MDRIIQVIKRVPLLFWVPPVGFAIVLWSRATIDMLDGSTPNLGDLIAPIGMFLFWVFFILLASKSEEYKDFFAEERAPVYELEEVMDTLETDSSELEDLIAQKEREQSSTRIQQELKKPPSKAELIAQKKRELELLEDDGSDDDFLDPIVF